MGIFFKKWRYFAIGCISVVILFYLKWWLALIGLVFLIYTHPAVIEETQKTENTKNAYKWSFYILLALPMICTFLIFSAKSQKEEKLKQQVIAESDRIENALVWDIEADPSLSDEEKSFVKEAAQNLIRNEERCVKLRMGGKSTVDNNQYYLQCENGEDGYGNTFNIYFTEDDIEKNVPLKIAEPYPENEAWDKCFQRKWQYFKFPDTITTRSVEENKTYTNGDRRFVEIVKAKNAMGVNIPHRVTCEVDKNGRIAKFGVEEYLRAKIE